MNQQGAVNGQPMSLTHEINLMPLVMELVEAIPNSGDQQEINRKARYNTTHMSHRHNILDWIEKLQTWHGKANMGCLANMENKKIK